MVTSGPDTSILPKTPFTGENVRLKEDNIVTEQNKQFAIYDPLWSNVADNLVHLSILQKSNDELSGIG